MLQSSLSDRCKEIILGSLLGDGSLKIQKSYKNARFSFRHSINQKDYFLWKVEEMKEISSENCVWEQNDNSGFGKQKLRYQSLATEALTELYKLTHPHGKFEIRRKWLNLLTPLSLCVWWLDDGSLVSDCRQGVFCTDDFEYDQLMIVVRYFNKVWELNPRIGRVAKKGPRSEQYRLWIRSSEELKKFFRIIIPHIPVPSMVKKVLILYKDPQLQERWISEICELSNIEI
ncbi:MAG: LAGLIDADG endonuclease, partial [Candidatus Poribacteria bacterium]